MENNKQYLFDNPKNINRLLYFLYTSCAVLFALDFVIHRHITHSWENLWGFYPVYGFIGCVILVLVATWMRTFLMRPEDYYDDKEIHHVEKASPDLKSYHSAPKNNTDKEGNHNVDD